MPPLSLLPPSHLSRVELKADGEHNPDERSGNDARGLVPGDVGEGEPEGEPDGKSEHEAYPFPDRLIGCSTDPHDQDDKIQEKKYQDDDREDQGKIHAQHSTGREIKNSPGCIRPVAPVVQCNRLHTLYPVRSRIPVYSPMGKSRRKLFISATISGIALRLGLPGLANLISLAWNTAQEPLEQAIPSDFRVVVSIAGLLIFGVIMYLNWEIYLKGAKRGRKGIITVVAGVVLGFFIGSILLALFADALGV
jgi:hypothetical protein